MEIITATREYLETVRAKVADARSKGASLTQTQEQLNPEIRNRWTDWDAPIWIDGAIERYYEEVRPQVGVS